MSRLSLMFLALAAACSNSPSATPAEPEPEPNAEQAQQAAQPQGEWSTFGDTFQEAEAISLADLLTSSGERLNSQVTVQGRISEVCQKAGCWLVISDDEKHMRVRMKDHAFSVDKGGAGRIGQIQGELISREVEASEVAHYAEETREGGVVPEHHHEGASLEIVASSVRLKNS